ncbi:hypothetical protein EK904_007720 [Melospiza melodia maxima]|nr:hypothetical protein EK904_007720 [Melospiza melodia maxima]
MERVYNGHSSPIFTNLSILKDTFVLALPYFIIYSQQKVCNEDCNFIELIEENHYNTYASAKWTHKGKEMFITLNHKGVPMKGKKTKKEHRASHFLPLAIS